MPAIEISVSRDGITYRQYNNRMFIDDREVFGEEAEAAKQKMHRLRDDINQQIRERSRHVRGFLRHY